MVPARISPGEATLAKLICPPCAVRVAGRTVVPSLNVPDWIVMLPPTSERLCPGVTVNWLPCTVMAPGFDPRNPNAATGDALNRASAFALGIALKSLPSASRR